MHCSCIRSFACKSKKVGSSRKFSMVMINLEWSAGKPFKEKRKRSSSRTWSSMAASWSPMFESDVDSLRLIDFLFQGVELASKMRAAGSRLFYEIALNLCPEITWFFVAKCAWWDWGRKGCREAFDQMILFLLIEEFCRWWCLVGSWWRVFQWWYSSIHISKHNIGKKNALYLILPCQIICIIQYYGNEVGDICGQKWWKCYHLYSWCGWFVWLRDVMGMGVIIYILIDQSST